jgi:hypothetical protein
MSVMPIWGAIDTYRTKVRDGISWEDGGEARVHLSASKVHRSVILVLIGM